MTRTDPPTAADERTTLTGFLDYARATVHRKCVDLAEGDATASPLPGSPLMSLSGLVSHLRWVEHEWFEHVLLGEEHQFPPTAADPDNDLRLGAEKPIGTLVREYEQQCARSREITARVDLDSRAALPRGDADPVTLRWILHHMVEETARHNGHIDILREMADGVTGD